MKTSGCFEDGQWWKGGWEFGLFYGFHLLYAFSGCRRYTDDLYFQDSHGTLHISLIPGGSALEKNWTRCI